MPRKNGVGAAIIEYVRLHPGCRAADIGAELGFRTNNGMLTWMRKSGMIFGAGPAKRTHFYPTAEAAWSNHERLCIECAAASEEKAKITARRMNLQRRARRHASGSTPKNTRRADSVNVSLPDGVTLAIGVKVVVAPKPRDRFAPEPGFERVITGDWMLRRQGVDVVGELRTAA